MEHNDTPPTSRHLFRVLTEQKPRVDVYLHQRLPWRSRNQLQALIADGKVTLNDRPCKPSQRVRKGDAVSVAIPCPPMPPLAFEPGQIPVLYLDDELLVVNKPSGILSHPIAGHQHDTLVNYVHENFGDAYGEPLLCHRLDRETSGTILIAFHQTARRLLQYQFEHHQIDKSYLAIVHGRFPTEPQHIAIPIRGGADVPSSVKGKRLKQALTTVRCIDRSDTASLVEAVPVTGRQNQIRIHLARRGYPLVGDVRFGGGDPPPSAQHFLLHAERLCFYHPGQKLAAEITAPLPDPFQNTLALFGLSRP
jgi:23S rRNA pseudouridine1911/1915/1917 synthase